jgi:hypothetical protein
LSKSPGLVRQGFKGGGATPDNSNSNILLYIFLEGLHLGFGAPAGLVQNALCS